MRKKNRYIKVIALVLSLILITSTFPLAIFAETIKANETEDYIDDFLVAEEGETIEEDEIEGVVELEALREENVKHFKLTDGTYQAVTYANAVHRKDANGNWKDIDNTVRLQTLNEKQIYSTNDSRTTFAKSFSPNTQLFSLNENGYSISMSFVKKQLDLEVANLQTVTEPITLIEPTVTNAPQKAESKRWDTMEEAIKIDNKSSVKYPNIQTSVDLEYVLVGNDVKENIIVKAPLSDYTYQFQLQLQGLVAELNEDTGEVLLSDAETDKIEYFIPVPYMYDANGIVSYDVFYMLTEIKEGVYLFTVTADPNWINATDRVFPVTIDPSISNSSLPLDTYIDWANRDTNYGYAEKLWVSAQWTTLIYMTEPNLPSGATFNKAYLYTSYYYNISTGSLEAGAYPILESWTEGSVTYNTAPEISTFQLDTATLSADSEITASTPGTARFDISYVAQLWYADAIANHGIAIKYLSGSNLSVILVPYEASSDDAPYMVVTYTHYVPDGVYAIESGFNLDYNTWMTVENDQVTEGAHLQYELNSTYPTSSFDRSSLFKISRVPNRDLYIIRSMLNNKLCFIMEDGGFVTKEIPAADADVSLAYTCRLTWDGFGYKISPLGSSSAVCLNIGQTNLVTTAATSTSAYACWNLVQYTGTHKSGTTLYRPNSWRSQGIVQGNSYSTVHCITWSTVINANTPYIEVAPDYKVLASSSWNQETQYMTLTAHSPGTVKINVQIRKGDTGATVYSGSFSYHIVPSEQYYLLQNYGTKLYMMIEDNSLDEDNVGIQQTAYCLSKDMGWLVCHVSNSDGYCRLQSDKSSLLLGVDENDTSSIIQVHSYSDYTLWRFERTASGNLQLVCKATGKSLSVPLSVSSGNGLNLTQLDYTNDDNYRDEWNLTDGVEIASVTDNAVYHVQAVHSGRVLDVYDEQTADGTNVIQFEIGIYKPWQSWRFINCGNGDYKIKDTNSGKLLTVTEGSDDNAYIWSDMGSASNQLFQIRKNSDGSFTFLSKSSGYTKALDISAGSLEDAANVIQYPDSGTDNQKFNLFTSTAHCPVVTIPCVYATAPGYSGINNYPVYINYYTEKYTSLLTNATWQAYDNGVVTFDLQNMTVTGIATGVAWLEAYDNGNLVLMCYVYSDNILKDFNSGIQDYLYADGHFLGTLTYHLYYDIDNRIDPLVFRTELFLYAVESFNAGCSDAEIKQGLQERLNKTYGTTMADNLATLILGEIDAGSRGLLLRENLTMSLDDLHFLLNFYWMQYAATQLDLLDTVNVYTPATAQDVWEETKYANDLCKAERDRSIVTTAQQAQVGGSSNYVADQFQVTLLKKGTKIYRLCEDSNNLVSGRWYTSEASFLQSGRDYNSIYSGLQVSTEGINGQRYKMAEYVLSSDVYVAYGIVQNNTQFGSGGYEQYFINENL